MREWVKFDHDDRQKVYVGYVVVAGSLESSVAIEFIAEYRSAASETQLETG